VTRTRHCWLLGILAAALLARLVAVSALGERVLRDVDQPTYEELALNLVRHQTLGLSFRTQYYVQPGHPTSYWPPLYPAFLAGIFGIAGHSYVAARLAQTLLGVLVCLLTYHLGCRLFGSTVGLVAAGLAAFYPHFVYLALILLTENLNILLVLVTLAAAYQAVSSGRLRWAFLAGAAGGVAALSRAGSLGLAVIAIAWLSWAGNSFRGRRLRAVVLGVLGILITVGPWTGRNWLVHREFVPLTTEGGMVLALLNHPRSLEIARAESPGFLGTTRYFLRHPISIPPEGWSLLPPPNGESEAEYDRKLVRAALGFIWKDPFGFLARLPGRFFWFWGVLPRSVEGTAAKVTGILSFGLLLPFVVVGLVRCVGSSEWRMLSLLWLAILYHLSLTLLFGGGGIRFRLPVEPLVLILASVGLTAIPGLCAWITRRIAGAPVLGG